MMPRCMSCSEAASYDYAGTALAATMFFIVQMGNPESTSFLKKEKSELYPW